MLKLVTNGVVNIIYGGISNIKWLLFFLLWDFMMCSISLISLEMRTCLKLFLTVFSVNL